MIVTDVDQCYLKLIKHSNCYLRMIKFLRDAIVVRDHNCKNIEKKSLLKKFKKVADFTYKKNTDYFNIYCVKRNESYKIDRLIL